MKKAILFFTTLLISCTFFFTGCIPGDSEYLSVYNEPWYETEGFVVSKTNERTGKKSFEKFEEGTPPEGSKIAVRYEHVYKSTPYCHFDVYELKNDPDNLIVNEFVQNDEKSDYFTIPERAYEENIGFIFYRKDDYVYFINDLFSYGYQEVNSTKDATLKFVIRISGMKQKEIYMKPTESYRPY